MKFDLVDQVLEVSRDRIVAVKGVSLAEEYLADHFPAFPVLPGVLMIEVMVQAARRLAAERSAERLVLGEIRAIKFGAMVRPGDSLRVTVTLIGDAPDGALPFKGIGEVLRRSAHATDADAAPDTAVSGRFTLRPIRA